MKKLLLLFFLFAFINGFSQRGSKSTEGKERPGLITNDSVLNRLKLLDDSIEELRKKQEVKEFTESSQRNLGYFLQLQKERRAKEKRNAIIRIGIGVALAIVLIFGLRRRMKK